MTTHSHAAHHDAHHVEVGPGDPPHIHHMDTPTAYAAAKLGMWLFLGTEILLFGGLFAAFAVYRSLHLEQFHAASHMLDWKMGATNTLILLFSSYTAAMAVDTAKQGHNKKTFNYLLVTIICGSIFLVIKYFEYGSKIHHGMFPGMSEWYTPDSMAKYSVFFGLYYCMTALHALHVILGMGLLAWVATKARRDRFSGRYYTPVEMGALYWHLVDLIWIYLFPLLYLVG